MTDDFETLFEAYRKDLDQALSEADQRYQLLAMSEKYNDVGFIYDRVWPAGVGGDPAVLHVLRTYFVKCSILIEQRLRTATLEEGEPSTAAEFLFGRLDESEDDRDEEMSYEIRLARFMPIGFEDSARIAEKAGLDGN